MKKSILSIVMLLSAVMLSAAPTVAIAVDNVTNTSITCSFTKNADCESYYILVSPPDTLEAWLGHPFAGATVEETVVAWGIEYTANTQYTWDEQRPNCEYVVYAVAKDERDSLYLFTDTVRTLLGGGKGASEIAVSVSDVSYFGVTTLAVPNDQTVLFKDRIIAQFYIDSIYSYFASTDSLTADSLTRDSIRSFLMLTPYEFYKVDQWSWTTLDSGTTYQFLAIGMNADSIWGDVASVTFTTLGNPPTSVVDAQLPVITLYPNPAAEFIYASGINKGETISIVDLRGNTLIQQEATSYDTMINLSGLVPGVYFLKTDTSVQKFIVR